MRFIGVAAGAVLLLVAFQNCGSVREASLYTKPTVFVFADYFHYPYEEAPELYGQIQLATSATAGSFNDVQYIAVFGRADGQDAVYDYDLDVVNESNYPVCPPKSGTAAGGKTSILDGCLSQTASKSVRVLLSVQTGGKTYRFEKKYDTVK